MDPLTLSSSTDGSTAAPNTQVVTPSSQTSTPAPYVQTVNAAQTTSPVVPTLNQTTTNFADFSAMQANYEKRVRDMMSEKDRAMNERDKVIAQYAELQADYTNFKAMNTGSLQASIDAGRTANAEAKNAQAQVAALEGQVVRLKVLLENPQLAPYQSFIPSSGTEEEIRNAVKQLVDVRNADLQRSGFLPTINPNQQGQSSQFQQGVQQQQDPNAFPLGNVYQGRSNLPQSLTNAMPGSNPAMMNANADMDPTTKIQQLFTEARNSSDPLAFERAMEQAKVISASAIQQQMGNR